MSKHGILMANAISTFYGCVSTGNLNNRGHTCYLLPSLYAAAFVRRTTSSTHLHPFLKRRLYILRFYHIIFSTGCGTFLKRVCHNTRTLLSYLHFYARTCKSIYRLITKTHPSMHIIVLKSKTHRCGKIKTHRCGKIQDI